MHLLQEVEVEIGSWVMIRGSSHSAKKSYSLSTPFWIGKVIICCLFSHTFVAERIMYRLHQ